MAQIQVDETTIQILSILILLGKHENPVDRLRELAEHNHLGFLPVDKAEILRRTKPLQTLANQLSIVEREPLEKPDRTPDWT